MLKLCKTCLAFAVVLPCPALAQDAKKADEIFKALDVNNDGKIGADEVRPERKAAFERLLRSGDKNQDGVLTREEFEGALKNDKPVGANPVGGRPGAGRPGGGDVGQFFDFLDKNKDGKLTLAELPEQAKSRLKPLFERLGKDAITKEEFSKLRPDQAGGAGRNRPIPVDVLFDRFDKDKNGKIKLAELPEDVQPRLKPLFERLGKDEVTREEVTQFAQRLSDRNANPKRPQSPVGDAKPTDRPRQPQAGDRPQGPGRLPVIFQKLDANGDGKISEQELTNAGKYFAELDRNKDGAIDPSELFGPRPQGRPGQDRPNANRPGQPRPTDRPEGQPGRRAFNPESFFKQLDRNNDGKLSRDEAPDRMKERFDQIDANKDGSVDVDEFRKAIQSPGSNPGRRPQTSDRPQRPRRPEKN
ncbi:MAG: EF-hand domain-containing protein [Planctomycetota bacterium]|nr:EF-hand domain-containing protein [Planctomycetota bacterium]